MEWESIYFKNNVGELKPRPFVRKYLKSVGVKYVHALSQTQKRELDWIATISTNEFTKTQLRILYDLKYPRKALAERFGISTKKLYRICKR